MPDSKHTFDTLARESAFKRPSTTGSTVPILNEFVAPHIESFNTLFDDSGLPPGDGDGRGLLSLAIKDIGERVVFDDTAPGSGQTERGNRLSIWIDHVSVARPMVPDKDKRAVERRIFPAEVNVPPNHKPPPICNRFSN